MKTKNIIFISIGVILLLFGLIFFANSAGMLQIISGDQVYYKINDRIDISFDFSPSKVGESSSSASTYQVIGGAVIVQKGSSSDLSLQRLSSDVDNIGSGSGIFFWGGDDADEVRDLKNKIDSISGRSSSSFEVFPMGGDKKSLSLYVPSVSGTYDELVVYEFFCEIGFKFVNEWRCYAEQTPIIGIDLNAGFCGNIGFTQTPTNLINANSWDEHCFFQNKPSYCDEEQNKCINLCSSDGACSDGYCLGRYADTSSDITNLLDKWENENNEGTLGCVSSDNVCKLVGDCRALGGQLSNGDFTAAHCEKTSIPSWLKDTNDLVSIGSFGLCQEGCSNEIDCTETIGDADNFKASVFGKLVAGESWTCESTGNCRLNLCNNDVDCWGIQRTQMSTCNSGECERVQCIDHYDCWNYVIIESGLDGFDYGCSAGSCTFRDDFSIVGTDRLTPSLCEAAFGIPADGKAWTVSNGKCNEEEVIEDECSPTSSQSSIQSDCEQSRGVANAGFEWGCFSVSIDGKYKGVCSEKEIPVTENCKLANNPDEYCMYDKGVDSLSRGRKYVCSANGICVTTSATCTKDSDCQVGSIGGSCVEGLCQYGVTPDTDIEIVCGNNKCEAGEDVTNCEADCGNTQPKFIWHPLYWFPILLTLAGSIFFGVRGKNENGKYDKRDFIIGAVGGLIIGIVMFYIFKILLWGLILAFFGGAIGIVIILAIGGIPLLVALYNRFFKKA